MDRYRRLKFCPFQYLILKGKVRDKGEIRQSIRQKICASFRAIDSAVASLKCQFELGMNAVLSVLYGCGLLQRLKSRLANHL